jgi:hypothetical protein
MAVCVSLDTYFGLDRDAAAEIGGIETFKSWRLREEPRLARGTIRKNPARSSAPKELQRCVPQTGNAIPQIGEVLSVDRRRDPGA